MQRARRVRAIPGSRNWVDCVISNWDANGYLASCEGKFLNGVATAGGDVGQTIGRVYLMTSVEIRLFVTVNDVSGINEAGRVMQTADTPVLIPAASFVTGDGPILDVTSNIPEIRFPDPLSIGNLRPFRMLLVLDDDPSGESTSGMTLDRVLDATTGSLAAEGGGVAAMNETYRERFYVIWDEVFNPKVPEMLIHRVFDFVEDFGGPLRAVNRLSGNSSNAGCQSGGLWLFITSLNPGTQPMPKIDQGMTRVYYIDG